MVVPKGLGWRDREFCALCGDAGQEEGGGREGQLRNQQAPVECDEETH